MVYEPESRYVSGGVCPPVGGDKWATEYPGPFARGLWNLTPLGSTAVPSCTLPRGVPRWAPLRVVYSVGVFAS